MGLLSDSLSQHSIYNATHHKLFNFPLVQQYSALSTDCVRDAHFCEVIELITTQLKMSQSSDDNYDDDVFKTNSKLFSILISVKNYLDYSLVTAKEEEII